MAWPASQSCTREQFEQRCLHSLTQMLHRLPSGCSSLRCKQEGEKEGKQQQAVS